MAERQNTLKELRELRDILRAQIDDASQSNIGRISSEYSKTLLEIDRLENEQNSDNRIAGLIERLARKQQSED